MATVMGALPFFLILLSALCSKAVSSYFDPLGRDLATYVTRPDLRPPLFNVTTYIPERVTPGYWFYTPYDTTRGEHSQRTYAPAQTGPHIFDNSGGLIWSGALEFGGEGSVSDFKVFNYYGLSYLSFIRDPRVTKDSMFEGEGVLLDPSYSVKKKLRVSGGDGGFNMHEFQVINDGRTALAQTGDRKLVDFSDFGLGQGSGYIGDAIFLEIDLETDKEVFRWCSSDHVPPNASYTGRTSFDKAWDYFHMNSVDKNAEGDYLISSRFTSCIYKISGKDGSIIWRLGGPESDFNLMGFNFSSQHHARFRSENKTTTVISFLNNASDMGKSNNSTANWSSAFLVALDTTTMTASLVRSWDRPDHELTRLRGAVEFLPDTNVFVSWSDNGFISEFSMDGELIQEARFSSKRFVDYRAFKFNFTGHPAEPPVLKAFVYGASNSTITTAIYVSWNGATEIKSWRFYGTFDSSGQSPSLLGTVEKTGFETVLVVAGHVKWTYAQAVTTDNQVLGRSTLEEASIMFKWWPTDVNTIEPPAPSDHVNTQIEGGVSGYGANLELTTPRLPVLANNCIVHREGVRAGIWVVLLVAISSSIILASLLKAFSLAEKRWRWVERWKNPFQRLPGTDH